MGAKTKFKNAGSMTVSDGLTSVDYRASKGVVSVLPEHVGAVLGAYPDAVVTEEADDDSTATPAVAGSTQTGA